MSQPRQPSHWNEEDIALVDLLDRALNKGVVIWGDVTLSVADVDLVYVGLKVLIASVDKADELRRPLLPAETERSQP